jgi:hypothetical protein
LDDEIERGVFEPMHVLSAGNVADVGTKALGARMFWPLVNDISGEVLTDVGRKMRRGEYAYQAAANARRLMIRPPVTLHSSFPGPSMAEYHGGGPASAVDPKATPVPDWRPWQARL